MFLEIFINRKKINIKIFGIPLLFIIIFSSTLTFEIIETTDYIFETVHDEKYDNVASLKFFTNFESKDFIDKNKYFFSDSFIGIVMFDTFNDFWAELEFRIYGTK